MKPDFANKTAFVTFYSFKGGVGRSMALINTAGILAGRRGFRVLVLDLDLEAPGLTYLDPDSPDVVPEDGPRKRSLQPGFVDLISDALERGEAADLFKLPAEDLEAKYTRAIKIPEELREFTDGSLRLMPSGRGDDDYARRLHGLNLDTLYRDGLGEPLIRVFKKKLAESGRYDYVLIDSRTGISEVAGICTRDLADHVMVLSGLNRQNVEGTSEFLREFREATQGAKKVQIILSPIPNGEDDLLDKRRAAAGERFEAAWGSKLDLSLEIPYHPQLALTEEPHIFRRRHGPLAKSYQLIESTMLKELGISAIDLYRRIIGSLGKGDYPARLAELDLLIRADGGRDVLHRLLHALTEELPVITSTGTEPSAEKTLLHRINTEPAGSLFLERMVAEMPDKDLEEATLGMLRKIYLVSTGLAKVVGQRLDRAAQTNPRILLRFASLLGAHSQPQHAEIFYRRAIAAVPGDPACSYLFAHFLAGQGRIDEAEEVYRSAAETSPQRSWILKDHGEFVAGLERFSEAERLFHQAYASLQPGLHGDAAELSLLLWLVLRMQGKDGTEWERRYKFLLERGFDRGLWLEGGTVAKAIEMLPPDEASYARALVNAFANKERVGKLEEFPRWQALDPLPPEPQVAAPAGSS